MLAREMRQKSAQELRQTLRDLLREQFNLRMQRGSGQLRKVSQVNQVRRDIARVQTVLGEKARETGK